MVKVCFHLTKAGRHTMENIKCTPILQMKKMRPREGMPTCLGFSGAAPGASWWAPWWTTSRE